ncbi:hypothetical protein [Vibrio cholerae]|uniref:hypothetical protein n=1 Tax=Vibrio cholerae TaxID=666 RepID=UPI000E0BC6D6|nr:hypothetical protein [Vibrio cholerae]EGQ9836765.1 hypothetical protein [Vibrio cholerae]EGR1835828.1 hypothetical protein [Vibrio cholerae]EGR4363013.1 hypothetical protein [Vibrio cholerae]EJL6553707.1 hypothetical protein [Vibrio cholerae]EKF9635775.1 hypothetical protein [Vibrio cholerae]
MFGPNTHFCSTEIINYSHRDAAFFKLFQNLTSAIKDKFELDAYDIIFVPGSGTLSIESVMFSLLNKVQVLGNDGVFKDRWQKMSDYYNNTKKGRGVERLFCQLETSRSLVNVEPDGNIVDAISAFPYYHLPKNTDIFVTCSNKILGSFVGLGIIGIKKEAWDRLSDDSVFSYLNLRRYKNFSLLNQTPSTTPTNIYEHLYKNIKSLDLSALRYNIDMHSDMIVDCIGSDNIIGERRCPVITLKPNTVSQDIAEKFSLYGLSTGKSSYQIFTYSSISKEYEEFCKAIKRNR